MNAEILGVAQPGSDNSSEIIMRTYTNASRVNATLGRTFLPLRLLNGTSQVTRKSHMEANKASMGDKIASTTLAIGAALVLFQHSPNAYAEVEVTPVRNFIDV